MSKTTYRMIGTLIVVVILVAICCTARLQALSSSSSSSLSDAPVSACDGVSTPIYPVAPGTLTALVNGQPVTHFIGGQPFQLRYTGDTGDSFQPQVLGVDADPYFDGSIQPDDTDSAKIAVDQQGISGTQMTATMTFPFTHPQHPNIYTKAGPYCFDVLLSYTRPDGQEWPVVAYIGLVEQ